MVQQDSQEDAEYGVERKRLLGRRSSMIMETSQTRVHACCSSLYSTNRSGKVLVGVRYLLEELQLLRHVLQDGKHLAVSVCQSRICLI